MIERNLTRVWGQLRAAKNQRKDFLERVRIRGLRGISDLSVPFGYPVSVLAGPNACGKSTVLFSLACAYKVPGAGVKEYVPSSIFPRFRSKHTPQQDLTLNTTLEYSYLAAGAPILMRWVRTKRGWDRNFGGAQKGRQPERALYLRTLANLSNPSEVRSYLQMGRQKLTVKDVDVSLLSFAHRILPFEYQRLSLYAQGKKEIFFAIRMSRGVEAAAGPAYSEFHMSAGERSVLRLSAALSKLHGALVLIDEVETGLHPFIQQHLMFELQSLALRNNLQIVVTTHSPVVIESVPDEGRIFLERSGDSDNVEVKPPYRDIMQRAMYGASRNKLSILCEDEVAEGVALGVFDHLGPKLQIMPADVVIGRDTGKNEFPAHLKALARFDLLDSFVFLLDGDARDLDPDLKAVARDMGKPMPVVLYLPGRSVPEEWLWRRIESHLSEYSDLFSVSLVALEEQMKRLASLYESASDKEVNKLKERFHMLCVEFLNREKGDVARTIGKHEAQRGELYSLTEEFETAIQNWRSQRS